MSDYIVTVGSARQSAEFAAAARSDHPWQVHHVSEEDSPWQPKPVHVLLQETERLLDGLPAAPRALINFGRASIPHGIDIIAQCFHVVKGRRRGLDGTAIIGPSPEVARTFGDKWLTYKWLRQNRFPVPMTRCIPAYDNNTIDRDVNVGQSYPFPAALKATDLTGGAGMEYVATERDLRSAIHRLHILGRPLILSEFVCGDEVSLDVLRLGRDCIVFPPGLKRSTDQDLTHADHKIKVNGYVREFPELEVQVRDIVDRCDLQGFFSIEGVLVQAEQHARQWLILEAATRVTNNYQLQTGSTGFDGFRAVSRYLRGAPWRSEYRGGSDLALSIPIYQHFGDESVNQLLNRSWVLQVKLERLSEMPLARDGRVRLTVKMVASGDLGRRLAIVERATGDLSITGRVRAELERLYRAYPCVDAVVSSAWRRTCE